MSRALLVLPLFLAACPSPIEANPTNGSSEGPERVLDASASSATLDLTVEVDEEVMSIRPDRRAGQLLTVQLDVASYLGACEADPCDPTVTAELRDADGAVLDAAELDVAEGGNGLLELQFDDPLGGCADDALCARDYTVDVAMATDGYLDVRSFASATVWIDEDWDHPIFQEPHVDVIWND